MARRGGLVAALGQYQREVARAQAAQIRVQTASQRKAEQARRAHERARTADEKERKRLYAEARSAEVDASNDDLDERIAALAALLDDTLKVDDYIDFGDLKTTPAVWFYDPGGLAVAEPPPNPAVFAIPPLTRAKKLLPGAKE